MYIIPNILRQALEENDFDYSKVTRGFKDRGFIETSIDGRGITRMHVQKWINGVNQKCFCIVGVMKKENPNATNPLN